MAEFNEDEVRGMRAAQLLMEAYDHIRLAHFLSSRQVKQELGPGFSAVLENINILISGVVDDVGVSEYAIRRLFGD
jgi:hypothetical protein